MINGIINVYKEKGFTSHDVVAKLRGIIKQKKIGHTGTLDPNAEGVLPVCLGKATKLCDLLTDQDKTYGTVLLLGKTTDTQDMTGKILTEQEVLGITKQEVTNCIQAYIGEYDQLPPMFSAIKVQGKKLYELAREGKEIERRTRRVTIYQIKILEIALPRVRMEVQCSKGTYIRTLCHDIGATLGCGGCMESLVRTKVSRFELKNSYTLNQLETLFQSGTFGQVVLPVDEMFQHLRRVTITPAAEALAYNGNEIKYSGVVEQVIYVDGESVRLYDSKGHFIGIFHYKDGRFRVEKMFLCQEQIRG